MLPGSLAEHAFAKMGVSGCKLGATPGPKGAMGWFPCLVHSGMLSYAQLNKLSLGGAYRMCLTAARLVSDRYMHVCNAA